MISIGPKVAGLASPKSLAVGAAGRAGPTSQQVDLFKSLQQAGNEKSSNAQQDQIRQEKIETGLINSVKKLVLEDGRVITLP